MNVFMDFGVFSSRYAIGARVIAGKSAITANIVGYSVILFPE